MSPVVELVLLAVGTALGVTLAAAAFVPTRPRLSDLLHDRPQAAATVDAVAHPIAREAARLAGLLRLTVPSADLEVTAQSRESFVLQRLGFALLGALWIPLLSLLLAIAHAAPPVFFTGAASLCAAAAGWRLPAVLLKAKARRTRSAFTSALASYCHLVALARLGDRGPVEALRYPASLGTGQVFRRIQLAIDDATLRGEMPWEGLERLAVTMGVRQLKDLGHIVTAAGRGGASIVDTLRAKAVSITHQQLAEQKTSSSIRSDRMDMPLALMGLSFIVFLAFPGLYTLVAN